MNRVFLSLGSNIGDKNFFIQSAIEKIAGISDVKIDKISSYYETDPVGYTDQDRFLNCIVAIFCDLEPYILLKQLQKIELDLKRERTIRWGPRTIDIDIICSDNFECNDDELIVPHPRMLERAFVLVPLCEIDSDFIVAGYTVEYWKNKLDISGVKKI